MYKDTKRGWGDRDSIQLVMQGYVIVAMVSTSGWDVLMIMTAFLFGIVMLRGMVVRVTALF